VAHDLAPHYFLGPTSYTAFLTAELCSIAAVR